MEGRDAAGQEVEQKLRHMIPVMMRTKLGGDEGKEEGVTEGLLKR